MFKKLSKVFLSLSLSVLACGGIFSAVNLKNVGYADTTNISVEVGGVTYTLEGKNYGSGADAKTFYVIDTVEDLSLVSYMVSVAKNSTWAGYNYELANDINLSSRNWTAIGTADNPYKGIFNGNGYTINGLNASKNACESEVFCDSNGDMISSPVNNSYYQTSDGLYYKFEENKGYVLQNGVPSDAATTNTTSVTIKNYYYYGLFGKISGAEISDIVMGKGCYAYRNNDEGVTAYSGVLAAYAENSIFYNVYDSMAEADSKLSEETDYYVQTSDLEVDETKTYYTLSGSTYSKVSSPNDIDLGIYYERVLKIDTGKYTYYYCQSSIALDFYRDPELSSSSKVSELPITTTTTEGSFMSVSTVTNGSFVIDDKAYYYDYNTSTGELCLNLKERYIVSSSDGTNPSISISGTTYYIKTVTGGMELYTTSDFETDTKVFNCLDNSEGYVTLGSTTYPYRYENGVFKILAYSEVCTIGYVSANTQFYKGNYYRLNSTQFVGVGSIDENSAYDGTINVSGTAYQYVFETNESSGNSKISFYKDAQYGYVQYAGQGNNQGVGTVSINNVNYIFNYSKTYKDLELSSVSTAITEIPYTVAEIEGNKKIGTLEKGAVISFNTSVNGTQSSATYYKKGSSDSKNSYKMILDNDRGLLSFDYYENFISNEISLPKEYSQAEEGEYYVVSDTAGYKFKYWTVPDENGDETIIYTDSTNGIHSYKVTSDNEAVSGKKYYAFSDGTFTETTFATGVYEFVDADSTITNIEANNNQVDATWDSKTYTFKVDIAGTVSSLSSIGYGEKWANIVTKIAALRTGYDLEVIRYSNDNFANEMPDNNNIETTSTMAYNFFYDYDNYGNLTTYSFLKATDTQVVEGTDYYTFNYNSGTSKIKDAYTKVEEPNAIGLSNYYVKVENVVIYGEAPGSGKEGYIYNVVQFGTAANVYLSTEWQKQPVNGKMSFTNTTDKYILTSDTSVVPNKSYYTYDATNKAYTLVTNPTNADIKTYFEETTKFLDGKFTIVDADDFVGVQKPVSKEEGSNWFFKLDDTSENFGIKFSLNTGYTVNYIYPSVGGSLDLSSVEYYIYDSENNSLTHVVYDTTDKVLKTTAIASDNIIVGKFVSNSAFTQYNSDGSTTEITDIYTDDDNYYIDTETNPGFAIVYIYEEETGLEQTTLYKNGQNFSYIDVAFTKNPYKLYIDIMRESLEFKVNISQDTGLTGTATIKVTEDGNPYTVQTKENVSSTENLYIKYDSYYDIVATPNGCIINSNSNVKDMEFKEGYVLNVDDFGIFNYSGTLLALGSDPTININLSPANFDAFAQYDFGTDGTYDDSLNIEVPSLEIVSTGATDSQTETGTLTNFTQTNNGKTTITSYGESGNVKATFTDNDYYKLSLDGIKYDIYNCEPKRYTLESEEFEITDNTSSDILAKISYNGNEYYILKSDFTVSSGVYSIVNKYLYTSVLTNNATNPFTNVSHKDLIIFKVSVEKVKYDISTLVRGVDSSDNLVKLKDYNGTDTETGNNVVSVKDTSGSELSQFVYGDTICLEYSSSDFYTFKGYRLKTESEVIEIANWNGSSWEISGNFSTEENAQTKYGTASVVDGKIRITFDKSSIASFGDKEDGSKLGAVICGIFEGKRATINVSCYTENSTIYNAFISNYDGKTSDSTLTPFTYSSNIISPSSSTIQNVQYGDTSNRTIQYQIDDSAPYKVTGFACHIVYNSSETKNIIIKTIDASTNGTLEISYVDLFNGNEEELKKLFKGEATLYILPILTQKTINVVLEGGANTTGNNVTNLTYYAGGDGLDISAYENHFSKTGYLPTGWKWAEKNYSTESNIIQLTGVTGVSSYYNGTITITRTWNAAKYKVYFNLSTGETLDNFAGVKHDNEKNLDYIEIEYDSAYEISSASKVGYTFNGWKLNGSDFALSGDAYNVDQDVTITPNFTANTYTIYASANKGTLDGEESKTENIEYNSKILDATIFSTAPTREGYTFSGWYAYANNKAVKIENDTLLSVALNGDTTFVDLSKAKVITIMASWTRVSDYYTLTDPTTLSYSTPYTSLAQNFKAIEDVKANGETILSTKEVISPVNNDNISFSWQYKATADGTYRALTDAEISKYNPTATSINLTNVSESGYYKVIITFEDTSISLTTETSATANKYVVLEKEIVVLITPLVVEKTLEKSYTTTFDTTTSPDLGFDLTAGVNNEKVIIKSYEIGNVEEESFVAGSDVGTYTTIRFYFEFADGYTYVAGNYSNVKESGGEYYFDQTTSITVNPKEVSLTPIVNEIAYTGASALILFSGKVTLNGAQYTLTVNANSKESAFGTSGTTTEVTISNDNFEIVEDTKSVSDEQKVSNYTFTLSGLIKILGENVKNYTFAGKVLTKDTSGVDFSETKTIDKKVNVDQITFVTGTKTISLTFDDLTADYEIVEMGNISYVYSKNGTARSLCFQLNNNATEVKVYSMFNISNVKFNNDILTYQENDSTYYLFGYYVIEGGEEVEVATGILSSFDGTASQTLSSVQSGKTYAIGYTDCVKVTLTSLEDNGTGNIVKYVKLGSELCVKPERTGYTFTGWENTNSDERITLSMSEGSSYNDTFKITGTTIAPTTLNATWGINVPIVGDTNNISRNANEGKDTITVVDILGGQISDKIINYNSSLTYTYEWFNSSSAKISDTDNITLSANTDSNRTYTLRIYNSTSKTTYKDITFTVTYNTVEIAISSENTKTTKEGNFEDVTAKALSDGKFIYDYSFGNTYDSYITINVPASTNADKNYKLSENKVAGKNIYFTVTKIKNANGETVSEETSDLSDAGTYKVTLCFNDKIYRVSGESSFEVVINPYTILWNDTSLKTLFGTETGKEAFEKTFGTDNGILKKTIYVTNKNVLTMTAPTSGNYLTQVVTFFNSSINGLKDGEEGKGLLANNYEIKEAKIDNTNYKISISETYPLLKVNPSDDGVVQVTLGTATKEYDGKAITSIKLEWNETKACYVFNAYASDNTLVVTFEISDVKVGDITSNPTNKNSFELLYYNVDQTVNIVDAKEYSASDLFASEMNKKEGSSATLPKVQIVGNTLLTITKKEITITKVTKVCDTNTTFDSSILGHVATITGIVASETVTVTGTYASAKAGNNITVSGLAISGDASKNYTLTNTTVVGEITSSNSEISASITENSFEYGKIKNDTDLSTIFNFQFKLGENILDNDYIESISDYKIVDKDTRLDVTDVYSTGNYLKAGTYKLSVKFTSTSFNKMNDTQTFEFTITKKEVTPVYDTITKVYDGNTIVKQTVTVVPLTGDSVTVNAVYVDANVEENKIVNLTLDSADKDNYVLSPFTITGVITERDSVSIKIINVDNDGVDGFVDNQYASGGEYTSNTDNTLSLNIESYKEDTTGTGVMEKLVEPTKAGYTFKGFFTEESCTTSLSADNVIGLINASIQAGKDALTIYAKWEINTYTITKEQGENTTITISKTTYTYYKNVSFEVSYGTGYEKSLVDVYSTENRETKTGLTESENPYSFTMPAYNVTIKTKATPKVYNISYELNGGTISDSKPTTHTYGTETSIPNPTREGCTFTGWKVNGTEKAINVAEGEELTLGATDYTIDITLEAQWQANTYKIYLIIDEDAGESFNESVSKDAEDKYYYEITYGTKPTLPEASKPGYNFKKWVYNDSNVDFDETKDYLTANDIELKPVFEAGTYTVNFKATNVTIAVYEGENTTTAEKIVTPTSGTVYSLIGGKTYTVIVTPKDGYTVDDWSFNETTYTTAGNLTFISDTEIEITASPNSNVVKILIDKELCSITAKVDETDTALNDIDGGYSFNANTDSTVVVTISINKGYSLGNVNFYGTYTYTESSTASAYNYTLTDFTTEISMSVEIVANSYKVLIKNDSNKKSTITFNEPYTTEVVESGTNVTVSTGQTLKFKATTKEDGFKFAGVKLGDTTIGVNSSEENINGTGIKISIDENGNVTITGFVEAFEIELLTEKQAYVVTLNKVAIDSDGKNNEEITNVFTLTINDIVYTAGTEYNYGEELKLNVNANTTGYKFVGWFTQITTSDEGVITYDTTYRISGNEEFSFPMGNEEVTYFAVYEISYVKHSLTVMTNDSYDNKKGGAIYLNDEVVAENNVLYKTENTYTAIASQGYKFVGWFYYDGESLHEATLDDGYTITTIENDLSGNAKKSTITFIATANVTLVAKFEAKTLNIEMNSGLLINGVLTYPNNDLNEENHVDYGDVIWGTFDEETKEFTPNVNGTTSLITTRTDDVVYVKVSANTGFLIENLSNSREAKVALTSDRVHTSGKYEVYKLSNMNADAGEYKITAVFCSIETTVSLNFVSNEKQIQAGNIEVEQSPTISIAGNRTSNAIVTAATNSEIIVRAYTKLGYKFATQTEGSLLGHVVIQRSGSSGSLDGVEIITKLPQEPDDAPKFGYLQYVDIKISGYTGGYIEIGLNVIPSSYNIVLKTQEGETITTIAGVTGGTSIDNYISNEQRNMIKNLEEYEGFSLLGFYPYSNGSGQMFIDAKGNGVISLNDNGYYWTGSAYETSPYFSIVGGTGTFTLYAVYSIDKTIIELSASPKILETTAPTVGAKVVIGNLNNANSWTNIDQPLYAEVLCGAKVSATAPKFDGYVFSHWQIERINKGGVYSKSYSAKETIPDLQQNGYKKITLTAIYNIEVQVSATSGGSAEVRGYRYVVDSNGLNITKEEITTTDSNYFSSLDAYTYKATVMNGYAFKGWQDVDGTIISTNPTYEVFGSPYTNLKAVFEGDSKILEIEVDSSEIGSLIKVTKEVEDPDMPGMTVEEEITDWSSINVRVGDRIKLYMNIPSQEYEAIWKLSNGLVAKVENDFYNSSDYRIYTYIVSTEDEYETDKIKIKGYFEARKFYVTVTFDLEDKYSNDELKLAGTVKRGTTEISSGYIIETVYGREVQIAISINKNYKVKAIEVDGEIIKISDVFKTSTTDGILRLQTSYYPYYWQTSATVKIIFARDLWTDEVPANYVLTGNGTEENPYKIASDTDLAYIAYMINVEKNVAFASAHYELLKDIDLTGKYWSPIGTNENPFKGSFDFNVFEISGVSVVYGYAGSTSYSGVFGVTSGANIFKTESNVGLIIGIAAGGIAVVGIAVGIFIFVRIKKRKEHERLANS